MHKTLILLMLCFTFLVTFKTAYSYEYTLYPTINTQQPYASNTYYTWSAYIYPRTPGRTVNFNFSWLKETYNVLTDETGTAKVNVKTPTISPTQIKTHTITISSPDKIFASVTLTIQIEIGIYPFLEYYSEQFYDPTAEGGVEGITLYVYPRETDSNTPVEPTLYDAVIKETGLKGVWQQIDAYKYKVVFKTSTTGKYNIEVRLSKTVGSITYVSVPASATVTLGPPKYCVKVVAPNGAQSYVGYDLSNKKVTADLHIGKGTEYLLVYFYTMKNRTVDPPTVDFIVVGTTGTTFQYSYPPGTEYLYAEKIGPGQWKVWHIFEETAYDLTVIAKGGILFQDFRETLKLSTVKPPPDIWSFIYSPVFMIPAFIIGLYLIRSLFKKKKKSEQ